jgi:hypothetical protein
MEKYRNANELCDRMSIVRQFTKRPNCQQILDKKYLWALGSDELQINQILNNILEADDQNQEFTVESMIRLRINNKSHNSVSTQYSNYS